MVIEDLRNVFTSCRDELIEVSGDYIYYAEEKVEEGHNILFLLEYNRKPNGKGSLPATSCRIRLLSTIITGFPTIS